MLASNDFFMTPIELLEEILRDQHITDVLFDGCNSALVDAGQGLGEISKPFQNEKEVELWARSLMLEFGSRLDLAHPISEVTLESSVGLLRVHAVLAGECSKRTQISIRRHSVSALTLEDLRRTGSLEDSQLNVLKEIIRGKENFVIVGGTGSGKTTLLKAMLNVASTERIISIEDAAELNLQGNCVSLTTRQANHEGKGEITLGMLLREALRMRPDRLVIGEARGEELLLLLQAMNTGHAGSGFTLHANSVEDLMPRVLAIMAGIGVNPNLARILVSCSITWAIELQNQNHKRTVTSIQRLGALRD